MKKSVFLTGICLFSIFLNSKIWAEESDFHGRFYLEPEIMAAIPTDDDTDATVFLGGRAGRELTSWFDVEIELGWAQFDAEFEGQDIQEETIIPLLGNIRFHLGQREKFDPYLLLGFGVSFNDVSFDEREVLGLLEQKLGVAIDSTSAEVDDSFAYQVGGGVLYHFNDRWSAFVEIRFFHTSPDGTFRISQGSQTSEVTIDNSDADIFFFGAGSRIRI